MTPTLSKTLDLQPLAPSDATKVPAQYQMALLRPRRWDTITTRLLAACESVEFCKGAYYRRPREPGFFLSSGFMEMAQMAMGNLSVECVPTGDGDNYRMTVTDLESNCQLSQVFLESNVRWRVIKRTLVAEFLPGEIRNACLQRCREVVAKDDGKDPASASKRLITVLGEHGVTPADLKELLGKSLTTVTSKDVETLRSTYHLLREGEITREEITSAPVSPEPPKSAMAPDKKPKPRAAKQKPATPEQRARAQAALAPPEPPKPRASLRDDDEDSEPVVTEVSSNAAAS